MPIWTGRFLFTKLTELQTSVTWLEYKLMTVHINCTYWHCFRGERVTFLWFLKIISNILQFRIILAILFWEVRSTSLCEVHYCHQLPRYSEIHTHYQPIWRTRARLGTQLHGEFLPAHARLWILPLAPQKRKKKKTPWDRKKKCWLVMEGQAHTELAGTEGSLFLIRLMTQPRLNINLYRERSPRCGLWSTCVPPLRERNFVLSFLGCRGVLSGTGDWTQRLCTELLPTSFFIFVLMLM